LDTKRRILLNSLSGSALYGVNVVVAFFLSPVIVRELGNQNYGIWDIMLSLIGYFSVLEFGLSPAIVRYVALASSQEDRERTARVFTSAFYTLVAAGLLSFLLIAALSLRPEVVLNLKPGAVSNLGALFLVMGATLFLQLPGAVLVGYLMGLQRHYLVNGARMVLISVQSVVIYLALTRWPGPGLLWMAGIYLVAAVVEYGIFGTLVLSLDGGLKPLPSRFSRTVLRELYVFGLKSFVLMVATRVRKQTMPLVIAHVLGVGRVVFYAIPSRLTEYAQYFAGYLGFPLMPYFSALSGSRDEEATRSAWFGLSRTLQFVLLWIPPAVFALGAPFIRRWMGPSYAEEGVGVIRLLAVALFVDWIAPNSGQLLVSLGRHGRAAWTALGLAVVNVALSIPLAHILGVSGVALAVALIASTTSWVFLVMACRAIRVPVWEHLTGTLFRFAVPLALTAGALYGLRLIWLPEGYAAVAGHAAISGTIYLVSAWFLALTGHERRALIGGFLRRA
jgi:O-antigen/teichoic acid export membrane protein